MTTSKRNRTARFAGYFFVLYYLVGFVGLSLPSTRAFFIGLMPLSLLLSAAILLFFHRKWHSTDAIVLLFIAITGYLIEVLGVLTGHVFGTYWYGSALGLKAFNTPLIIGLNWLMLTYCVYAVMEETRLFWPLKALAAGVLMVVFDFVMEPVAMRLDMWHWQGGVVPIQNYQAWLIISLVFLAAMHLARIKTGNRVAPWLFGVMLVFFLALNITLRLL